MTAAELPPVLVAGAGAIGGFLAAALTDAGADVRVFARAETARTLAEQPLRLREEDHERTVNVRCVTSRADLAAAGLLLVAVKSFDTAPLMETLAPDLTPGIPVLSVQNGVDNPATIESYLPNSPVGAVAAYLGCQRLAPDLIVRRVSRDPATGAVRDRLVGGGPSALGDHLATIGRLVGVTTDVHADYRIALWTKLVANVALNTVTTLGRARVGRVFADPQARELMRRLGDEVVAVAHAMSIDLPRDAAAHYVADAASRLPADGGSSMLFDREARRRLERGALVGAVVRHGDRLGVPVPVCRVCAALLELADPYQENAF